MALKVKKKKKKLGSLRRGGGGGSSVETSPYRPLHVHKKAPCQYSCPSGTKIREFLTTISQAEDAGKNMDEAYTEAYKIIMETNPLPAVCGRVCPHPCEDGCNRQFKEGSLSIHNIERFLGDYGIKNNVILEKETDKIQTEKIAVVGSGPAGLSCAYHLSRKGYEVTIYEAFEKSGGMLRYGIPDYRLPQDVLDAEVERIQSLGVKINYNTSIGKDMPYSKLQADFDAIFVGIGAHKGRLLGIPNEDSSNVMTGAEFLNEINAGQTIDVGDKVLVVGGGDTAIDAARISRRLGAEVTLVYRRTRAEMPAIEEEIVGAEKEDVKFHFLASPLEFVINSDNKVTKMTCQQMELGEPDSSGRRRPVPIDGEFFDIETTMVISSISQEPDFEGLGMLREGKDWVKKDEHGETPLENTYAGGDVTDLALVTTAIGHGRCAAEAIHMKFRGLEPEPKDERPVVEKEQIVYSYYEEKQRQENFEISPEEGLESLDKELSSTYTDDQALEEAKRCMSCGECFDCGTCWSLCQDQVIVKPLTKFKEYTFKMDACKGCTKCAESCPCGFIEMKNPMTGEFQKFERVK